MSTLNPSAAIQSLPRDVIQYASAHGLLPHLYKALALADGCFNSRSEVEVTLETDHETGDKRLILNVQVDGGISEVLKRYQAFSDQWVASAPLNVVHRIGLLYSIQPAQ